MIGRAGRATEDAGLRASRNERVGAADNKPGAQKKCSGRGLTLSGVQALLTPRRVVGLRRTWFRRHACLHTLDFYDVAATPNLAPSSQHDHPSPITAQTAAPPLAARRSNAPQQSRRLPVSKRKALPAESDSHRCLPPPLSDPLHPLLLSSPHAQHET